MEIDHIFIFSSNQGKETDDLVDFGFTEGSNRVHPGQGTVNRKIYFENFFLEIVWVHKEAEIRSENVATTKLWERSNFINNGYSPFGLGFVNTPDTDKLFKHAIRYQPEYFPAGTSFEILTNELNPCLPWTFRMPLSGPKKQIEPIDHANGIRKLTRAIFEMPTMEGTEFTSMLEANAQVKFRQGSKNTLILEFDAGRNRQLKKFDKLNLVIRY